MQEDKQPARLPPNFYFPFST
ncbi:hypothetical protein DSM3645_05645 [Blastopirellula marina DSM 3645]|uniref:Uncharacterized protein n=1 Tax=Blastopirellula marina DSM 3645 TaxID=314230 RepID=A3ZU18_9BACT|nr:hypothetical protein DSM3645_05645 [Blastopirellula marina DSM 3645]